MENKVFIIIAHMISIILFYKCGYYILESKIKDIISKIKKRPKSIKLTKIKEKKKKKKAFLKFQILPKKRRKLLRLVLKLKKKQIKAPLNYQN